VAVLEKIVFKDFSVGGRCNLFQYGVTYDCLDSRLTFFEIYAGTLNGIVGEFGDGGAILSYVLTNMGTHKVGSTRKKNNIGFYEGKIYVDDKEETIDDIVRNSWYIGYDIYGFRKPLRSKTINEQIKCGLRITRCDLNVDAIKNMFEISGVGSSIQKVGVERWKASIAIGFAYSKKIFCFPWMNSKDIELLEEQMTKSIKVLIENNCIVVLPTTKEENITKLSEKNNIVNVSYNEQYGTVSPRF